MAMKTKDQVKYEELYGHYPDTRSELVELIRSEMKIDPAKEAALRAHIQNMKWKELQLILYIIPKPSPRPKWSPVTKSFYVKNAAYNKKSVEKILSEYDIIYTNTHIDIKTYQPTPKAMKPYEVLLAEEGLIEPIQNPDFDNLAKTYTDMLQDNLLVNDNIISKGHVEKFYSLKPRVEINIKYAATFDCNFNKSISVKSKKFIDMIDPLLYEAIQSEIIVR